MSNLSATVIQSMFNHLAASYTEDEAREILVQKYPDASEVLANIKPENYRVTQVEMGSKVRVVEPTVAGDGETVAPAKAPKAPKVVAPAAPKAATKADRARELYAAATDKSRGAMIDLFVRELGMSKSGASTYFYNVKS